MLLQAELGMAYAVSIGWTKDMALKEVSHQSWRPTVRAYAPLFDSASYQPGMGLLSLVPLPITGKLSHLSCGISGGLLIHEAPPECSPFPCPQAPQPWETGSHMCVLFLFYKNITCCHRKVGIEYIIHISETSSSCQQKINI